MSSGTPRDRNAGALATQAGAQAYLDQGQELNLSPRQIEMNRRWSWYKTSQYDHRMVDWNGRKMLSPLEREQFAHNVATPAGWNDFGRTMPIKFRRPDVAYHLPRIIVDRFTSLMFSEDRHPAVSVAGDAMTDDFLSALIESSRFWARWREARAHGGSMGTACVGFKFVRGVPRLEVHDPRWSRPTFIDREAFELGSLDIRYPFDQEKRDENGRWFVEKQWHRRYIDDRVDIVFKPIPVGSEEPKYWPIQEAVDHKLGFFPGVWVQNRPVGDDIDGEPDILGILDNAEAVDALYSQSNRGTIANCDPTLVMNTDEPLEKISKGSDNAIKLEKGGGASYLELQATGPKAARELAQELRDLSLEIAACVLERPEDSAKTATEINRRFASMTAMTSVMREQYADFGIKPLARKMLTASRVLTNARPTVVQVPNSANVPESAVPNPATPSVPTPNTHPPQEGATTAPDENPKTKVVEGKVFLPPKVEVDENGMEVLKERRIGPGPIDIIRCKWPQFFEPTSQEAQTAVGAASAAFSAKLLAQKEAVEYIAPFFRVEDPADMLRRIKEEGASSDQAMMGPTMGQMPPDMPIPGAEGEEPPPDISQDAPQPPMPPQNGAAKPPSWGVLGGKPG